MVVGGDLEEGLQGEARNQQSPTQPDGGELARPDTRIGHRARDAQEAGGLFHAVGQRSRQDRCDDTDLGPSPVGTS